ncbi:unnamed protein product [Dracunculus medinensis]|uniref:Cuticlin N-terminal domain-containing protein n=1 Tax=Dracunculus medinensis TaxID=318479 RepID=A0A3P7Q7H1_DRAME|nr:unnamed protein product [Dracunculus medinensis]
MSAMCSPEEGITASIDFDQPFSGKIYSMEYSTVHECIYFNTVEMKSILFTIPIHRCGTRFTKNTRNVIDSMENRVYIQMDKDAQTGLDRQYSFMCQLVPTLESTSSVPWLQNAKANQIIFSDRHNWGNWPIYPLSAETKRQEMQKWEIEQKILEKSSSHADSPQQTSLSNADIFSERTVLDMQKWKEKVFIPTDKRPRVHKNQIANHVISSTIGKSAFNESIIPITRYIFF